jgi:phage/plasmid primase-like uncharacterized protein
MSDTGNAQARDYLKVPFAERDGAKAAGARWDSTAKSWYVGPDADLEALAKWRTEPAAPQDRNLGPREQFIKAMQSAGLVISGEHPVMDGEPHRIAVEGDHDNKMAGQYTAYMDDVPNGTIRNYRTGERVLWQATAVPVLSPEQKKEMAQTREDRQAQRDAAMEAASRRVVWAASQTGPLAEATPYMVRKGIEPTIGALAGRDASSFALPAYDVDGKHWTTQTILEDGKKLFTKDSRKNGCFHVLGGQDALKDAPVLILAEGYATGASVSLATHLPTVIAFDAGNLKPVAIALHEKYPDKQIIIAGDDDYKTQINPKLGRNPGREKAGAAAEAVGGSTVFPPFTQEERALGLTDFNDLAQHSAEGRDRVEQLMAEVLRERLNIEPRQPTPPAPTHVSKEPELFAMKPEPTGADKAFGMGDMLQNGIDAVSTLIAGENSIERIVPKGGAGGPIPEINREPGFGLGPGPAPLDNPVGDGRKKAFESEPDLIINKYYVVEKGAQRLYYDDYQQKTLAMKSSEGKISTTRQDMDTIKAMFTMAEARGWDVVDIKGSKEFKREAWFEAEIRGIKTRGYEPSDPDHQEAQRRAKERGVGNNRMRNREQGERLVSRPPNVIDKAAAPAAPTAPNDSTRDLTLDKGGRSSAPSQGNGPADVLARAERELTHDGKVILHALSKKIDREMTRMADDGRSGLKAMVAATLMDREDKEGPVFLTANQRIAVNAPNPDLHLVKADSPTLKREEPRLSGPSR